MNKNPKVKTTKLGQSLLKSLKEIVFFERGAGNLRATLVEESEVSIDSLLKGIGCNMMAERPSGLSPEECLVELSPFLLKDPKALVLAIGAVTVHAQVFNAEILLKAMTSRKCDFNVIGALMIKADAERFRKVIEFCREQNFVSPAPAKTLILALQLGQSRADQEFQSFGLQISQFDPVDEKKITKSGLFRRF